MILEEFEKFKNSLNSDIKGNLNKLYDFVKNRKYVFEYVIKQLNFYTLYNHFLYDFQKEKINLQEVVNNNENQNKNKLRDYICINLLEFLGVHYGNI